MTVRFWGVRGSTPAPPDGEQYRAVLRGALEGARKFWGKSPNSRPETIFKKLPSNLTAFVGGETSCIEIQRDADRLVIDLGTGARPLGYSLLREKKDAELHVLLTGSRWEQIQGWPFFIPGYLPGRKIHIYSQHGDFPDRISHQQLDFFFPVTLESMLSNRVYHPVPLGEEFPAGAFRIRAIDLEGEGMIGFYRIRIGRATIGVLADPGFFRSGNEEAIRQNRDLFRNLKMLLVYVQAFPWESETDRGGGRLEWGSLLEAALLCNMGKIVLTHYGPGDDDLSLYRIFDAGRQELGNLGRKGKDIELLIALEGEDLELA